MKERIAVGTPVQARLGDNWKPGVIARAIGTTRAVYDIRFEDGSYAREIARTEIRVPGE